MSKGDKVLTAMSTIKQAIAEAYGEEAAVAIVISTGPTECVVIHNCPDEVCSLLAEGLVRESVQTPVHRTHLPPKDKQS